MTLLFGWAASLIGPRFAKPVTIAVLILLAVVAILAAKSCYDSSVIEQHDANQRAATSEADRKADANAATQMREDDRRLNTEADELRKVNENATSDIDRRRARQRCIRLQQSARAEGRQPPAC